MVIYAVDDEKRALNRLVKAIIAAAPEDEVLSFSEEKDALEAARHNPPDVAFLDIQLWNMTGLELAERLREFSPKLNVVFTTGYDEYALNAIKMRASGYLTKPITQEMVREELLHLRFPIEASPGHGRIRVITFGNFDLVVDGSVVHFSRSKSKEMLAFLVDLRGSGATKKEIAAVLFEDREYSLTVQDYMNKISQALVQDLGALGAEKMLVRDRNYYAVDRRYFTCDLYEYEENGAAEGSAFRGMYMSQYSWGETTLGWLLTSADKI